MFGKNATNNKKADTPVRKAITGKSLVFCLVIFGLLALAFVNNVSADDCSALCSKCNLFSCDAGMQAHHSCQGNQVFICWCKWQTEAGCSESQKWMVEDCTKKGMICEQTGTCQRGGGEARCVKPAPAPTPKPGGSEGCSASYVDKKTCYVIAPQEVNYVISQADIITWTSYVTLPQWLGGETVNLSVLSPVEFNVSFKSNISDLVPFTITSYSTTWESTNIHGASTGVNYETLNPNYNSSGFFNRTTGQIISSFSTIITNDIYTTKKPIIARGYIIGTVNCTNNITDLLYNGTLEFPYVEVVPSLNPIGFIVILISLFGLAAIAIMKMYKR